MSGVKQRDELSWLAFQYVAGEMSEDESAAFEARMLDDVEACEAVARVALICETANESYEPAVLLESAARRAPEFHARRRLRQMVSTPVLAGLALLLCAGLVLVSGHVTDRTENALIVSLWSSTAEEPVVSTDDVEVPAVEVGQAAELVVPDWMIAAVQLESTDDDDVLEN